MGLTYDTTRVVDSSESPTPKVEGRARVSLLRSVTITEYYFKLVLKQTC